MPRRFLIVPIFNEERRLDIDLLASLPDFLECQCIFVDDGSRDGTNILLKQAVELCGGKADLLTLEVNVGKAEAVRCGINLAIERHAEIIGFCDSDLAAPPHEVRRLFEIIESQPAVDLLLASRVRLFGSSIDRTAFRHLIGRIFATFASVVLGAPIYDTQCGLKVMKVTSATRATFSHPFADQWAFDVELIGRFAQLTSPNSFEKIREIPLTQWRDVGGSKVKISSSLVSLLSLLVLRRNLRNFSKVCEAIRNQQV
jgi:dolichyl-phosphate beta-glucosyltransferase